MQSLPQYHHQYLQSKSSTKNCCTNTVELTDTNVVRFEGQELVFIASGNINIIKITAAQTFDTNVVRFEEGE